MSSPAAIAIERTASAHAARAGNRQRRTNNVLAAALVGIVATAPIPLGSNRPFFWALWAAILGLIAAGYAFELLRNGETLRFALARLIVPISLFSALAAFLLAQSLPLAGVSFVTSSGDTISSRSLSLSPGATWLALLQVASYGLFFLLMLQVAVNRRRARLIANALLAVIAVHALYGLAALVFLDDSLLFFEKWAYQGYATGPFVNRNSFATFLAFGLVLAITLAARQAVHTDGRSAVRWGPATMHVAAAALILAALLATGSRMGLVAGLIGAGSAMLMAMQKHRADSGGLRRFLLAMLPFLAVAAIVFLYGGDTIERLGSIVSAANVRGDLYAQVMQMIAARPWLGYGGGSFEIAYPLFHQLPVSVDLVWDKAHSTYLGLWADFGLIAGSIPLLIVAWALLTSLVLYVRRNGDWALPAAAVSIVVVAALHSLVDFSLEIEANVFVFLAILALGIARPADAPASGAFRGRDN